MDVTVLWNQQSVFGPSPMYTSPSADPATLWDLSFANQDANGINGLAMLDGQFQSVYFNLNLQHGLGLIDSSNPTAVPLPPAAGLFLVGLAGIAARSRCRGR